MSPQDAQEAPAEERRSSDRLVMPPCPQCKSHRTRVRLRLEHVLYVVCDACGRVWDIKRPEGRYPV